MLCPCRRLLRSQSRLAVKLRKNKRHKVKPTMALSSAAQRGDHERVAELMCRDKWPAMETWFALSLAAANDWPKVVDALVVDGKIGPDHTCRIPLHASCKIPKPVSPALFWAAACGSAASARRLLEARANVEGCGASWKITALGIAAINGHTDVVKLLISAKGQPNGFNIFGTLSPLVEAERNGHARIAALLRAACSLQSKS